MVSSKATTKALPSVAHSQRWVLCIHRLNYFFNNLMEHTLYAWFSQEELRHLLQSQGYYYTLRQDFQSTLCDLNICALIHQATQIPEPLSTVVDHTHFQKLLYIHVVVLSKAKPRQRFQEDGLFDWLTQGSKGNYFATMVVKSFL